MNRPPFSVSVTLMLIVLNAAFWLAFAIITVLGLIRSIAADSVIKWVMVILALGTSALLVGTVIFLRRHNRLAFYISVAFLAIIAVFSITESLACPISLRYLSAWSHSG